MPRHDVYLNAFYVDRYQVDVRRYDACVADGGCTPLQPFDYDGHVFSDYPSPYRPLLPVWTATHAQAEAFCAWDGAALLSGAQWERAAAGVQDLPTDYPYYVEYPYSSDYCVVFPGSASCDGYPLPRIYEDVYSSIFRRRHNSIGIGGFLNYFEWTQDTMGSYVPSEPPAVDPVITGDGPYEMRGMMSQQSRFIFEVDITERYNVSAWGDTEHASFRCARRAEGQR